MGAGGKQLDADALMSNGLNVRVIAHHSAALPLRSADIRGCAVEVPFAPSSSAPEFARKSSGHFEYLTKDTYVYRSFE